MAIPGNVELHAKIRSVSFINPEASIRDMLIEMMELVGHKLTVISGLIYVTGYSCFTIPSLWRALKVENQRGLWLVAFIGSQFSLIFPLMSYVAWKDSVHPPLPHMTKFEVAMGLFILGFILVIVGVSLIKLFKLSSHRKLLKGVILAGLPFGYFWVFTAPAAPWVPLVCVSLAGVCCGGGYIAGSITNIRRKDEEIERIPILRDIFRDNLTTEVWFDSPFDSPRKKAEDAL
jgi:hypothetical protein